MCEVNNALVMALPARLNCVDISGLTCATGQLPSVRSAV